MSDNEFEISIKEANKRIQMFIETAVESRCAAILEKRTINLGDKVLSHGLVTQFASGNPKLYAIGNSMPYPMLIVELLTYRGEPYAIIGPDNHGNTYRVAVGQLERVDD